MNVVNTIRGEGEGTASSPLTIDVPIVLTGSNSWSLGTFLGLNGGITGIFPLDVSMGAGTLGLNEATEVGPVGVTGEGHYYPRLTIGAGNDLNGIDREPVSLHDASLIASGTVGPLTIDNGELVPGWASPEQPAPVLHVEGALKLEGHVAVYYEPGVGSGIRVAGAADIGSARLEIAERCLPAPGTAFTLLEAQGRVTGEFTNGSGAVIANGETFQPEGECEKGSSFPPLRIEYSPHAVTATVLSPGVPKLLRTPPSEQQLTSNVQSGSTGSAISSGEVASLLRRELIPGRKAKVAIARRADSFVLTFTTPEAGTALIRWYQAARGASRSKKAKVKPALAASGHLTFTAAGTSKITIKLTREGRRLLKRFKDVKLTATGTFTPIGGTPVTATEAFVLGQ